MSVADLQNKYAELESKYDKLKSLESKRIERGKPKHKMEESFERMDQNGKRKNLSVWLQKNKEKTHTIKLLDY